MKCTEGGVEQFGMQLVLLDTMLLIAHSGKKGGWPTGLTQEMKMLLLPHIENQPRYVLALAR
jgi:hypothetical protein